MSLVLLGIAAQGSASTTHIIDFEDLSGQAAVPSNYAGFQSWGNFEHYGWSQPPYNAHSGEQRVYSDGSMDILIGHDISFEGAWFAGYYTASFSLYDGGTLVHESAPIDLSETPTFAASGYTGPVDRVVINATPGQFVMDDFQYSDTKAVPEPASMAALGLGALGIVKRRRKA